jgi:hypothetical protein
MRLSVVSPKIIDMKSLIFSLLACFSITSAYCDGPRFSISDVAKPIVSWNAENEAAGKYVMTGKLSSGDEVIISTQANALLVRTKHGKEVEELLVYVDEAAQDIEIGVYEYDFDNDGSMEIIVADANEYFACNVHVYSYSGGLSELVGNFFGQEFINIENNILSLPFGSQGLASEYLYSNGAFFELIYHDPNAAE